jgi:Skp family chaperone for outer membrane proteins
VKKKLKLCISIFFFLLLATNSFANKIAFIDLDELIKKTNLGQKISKQLENKKNSNTEEIKKKEKSIKKLENEIRKKQNILSKEELKIEITKLQNKIKKFNSYKAQTENDFNLIKNDEILKFFNTIDPLIQSFLSENSIDILFNNKNIIIGKDSLDITDKIINVVNNSLE